MEDTLSKDEAKIVAKLTIKTKPDFDVLKVKAIEDFGVPYDEVTEEQRRVEKTIRFGELYGMSGATMKSFLDSQNFLDKMLKDKGII